MANRYVILLLSILAYMLVSPEPAHADEINISEAVVKVTAYGSSNQRATGFVVTSDGVIVAPAHLVRSADRVTISSLITGAEVSARVVDSDEDSNVALLRAIGFAGTPLTFSDYLDYSGRTVTSISVSENRAFANEAPFEIEGSVGRIGAEATEHNAMIPKSGFGGPLLNSCREVMGVNRPEVRRRVRSQRRQKDPETVVFASNLYQVRTLLDRNNVAYKVSDTACPTAEEKLAKEKARADYEERLAQLERDRASAAEIEAARAEEEKRQALVKADEQAQLARQKERAANRAIQAKIRAEALSEAQKKELEDEQRIAELDAQKAEDRYKALQAQAEKEIADSNAALAEVEEDKTAIQKAAEEYEIEAKAKRRELFLISGGVGLFLLLLLLLLLLRARSLKRAKSDADQLASLKAEDARRAQSAAAEALREFPDGLLEGKNGSGSRIAVRFSGAQLVRQGELILGRHPEQADIVIDDPSVSRAHAAIYLVGDELLINDLSSTNGTKLNGQELDQQREPLSNNDELKFGDVVVKFISIE